MKRFFSLMLSVFIILASIPVMAEDFAFDIYDSFYTEKSDEAVLMEVEDSVKADLEERLISAWENMDTEVQLYPDIKIHKDDIASIFAEIYFENPKYYYVARSFSGKVNNSGYLGTLTKLSYTTTDRAEVEKTWAEIDKATEEILFYISPDMTDFEKIITVHDYMVLNYEYDITDMDQTYLIMLDKKGVCAAYSEAFQHVMNKLDIDCTLVRSEDMGHIWNMVKLNNRWYHIDVTWDDPIPDQVAGINHRFVLLSDNAIQSMGHTGFEAPYYASSTSYNDAPWRDDESAIVTVDNVMYRIEGNNLIDENGRVIYEELDGGDGNWSIGGGYIYENSVYSGICVINGILYFNTDKAIYSYNPKTEAVTTVLEKEGVCGIFADKNLLVYNKVDLETNCFVKSGEIRIADAAMAQPYFENGEAVIRLYNDCDVPVWIISEGDGFKIRKVDAKGFDKAVFENGDSQTIYVWRNSLEPVLEKLTVAE